MGDGLWNSGVVRLLRWLLLVPLSFVAFFLAELVVSVPIAMYMATEPPGWAVILTVLLGGGVVFYLLWILGVYAGVGVAILSPVAKVGTVMVGTLYVLGQTWNLIYSWERAPWWQLSLTVLITIAVLTGLRAGYGWDDEVNE
ncbi:MAG: hypothetical protein Rubg2KO_15260 [Rubricoccaceae bacterium]